MAAIPGAPATRVGRGCELHWMRKTDPQAGIVTFTVIDGHHMHDRLTSLGFQFDERRDSWSCSLTASDERVGRIEAMLRASEGRGRTGPNIPRTVRG